MSLQLEKLMQAARDAQDNDKVDSIENYKKAIQLINDIGRNKHEDDFLTAHWQISETSFRLERGDAAEEFSLQGLEYAQKCIDIITEFSQDEIVDDFIKKHVLKFSATKIAIHTCAHALSLRDRPQLKKALALIDIACQYHSKGDDIYFQKAQILLKLRMPDKAYAVVKEAIANEGEFEDFEEILTSKAYKKWLDKLDSAFSDEEIDFLKKVQRIIKDIPKSIIPENADRTNLYTTKLISNKDASSVYDFVDERNKNNSSVLLLKGDVYLKGNLNLEWINAQVQTLQTKERINHLIIDGHLYLDGELLDGYVDDYIELHVTGNVYANFLYSEDGSIKILGETHIREGVQGVYNDGELNTNACYCPFIVNDTDHSMSVIWKNEWIAVEMTGPHASDIYLTTDSHEGYIKQSQNLLKDEVWDSDHKFDANEFFGFIHQGISPFKELN